MNTAKRVMGWTIRILTGLTLFGAVYAAIIAPAILSAQKATKRDRTNLDMEIFATTLGMYRKEYGTFPQAQGADIVLALMGQNPKKIMFLEFKTNQFDGNGHYLDGWDRPFVFTFSKNGSNLMIRSLGENGIDENGQGDDLSKMLP